MSLSERHRKWGWDCPAVDLDFLFLEYDMGEPVAIVEYKHENARTQWASHPTYQAMIKLGTRAGVPVLAARYAEDFSWWRVVALNDIAEQFIPEPAVLTERQWVTLLYQIRGRRPDPAMFSGENVVV